MSYVRGLYPGIKDVMVNLKSDVPTEYIYFSDAGRKFKMIYDPLNNDIINSDDNNIAYDDLNAVLGALSTESGNIISIHPHRWCGSATIYLAKTYAFKLIRSTAKMAMHVPGVKKIMSRYYYLAKKI